MKRVVLFVSLFVPSLALAEDLASTDARRQQPGESFTQWKARHDAGSQQAAPEPLTNQQILRRLHDQRVREIESSPEYKAKYQEYLKKNAEAYKAREEQRQRDQANKRAAWAAERDAQNEQARQEYNKNVDRHNALVDTYNRAQADSAGRLDAAWELQRRSMQYDAFLNSGQTYMLPPVFIGAYGHP